MKNALSEHLGFMSTQYERFGTITEDEVIEAYIDEKLCISLDLLWAYNEYLEEQGLEPFYSFDEFDEILTGKSPLQVAQMCFYGKFSYADDFFQFNGYGNIDTFSEGQIINQIKEDRDFLRWYVRENDLISEEDMENAIKYGCKFIAQGW